MTRALHQRSRIFHEQLAQSERRALPFINQRGCANPSPYLSPLLAIYYFVRGLEIQKNSKEDILAPMQRLNNLSSLKKSRRTQGIMDRITFQVSKLESDPCHPSIPGAIRRKK